MNKIISRKKSRKYLFQRLYSLAYKNTNKEIYDDSFMIDSFKGKLDEEYIKEQEKLILNNEKKLIALLELYAPKFPPEKMDLTYVIPIFIGASEMLFFSEEIPAKVSINESIELVKTYGTDTARKIVNGVLNQVYKNYDYLDKNLENLLSKTDFNFFKK